MFRDSVSYLTKGFEETGFEDNIGDRLRFDPEGSKRSTI